jgi:GT2 family glycosyltransferase
MSTEEPPDGPIFSVPPHAGRPAVPASEAAPEAAAPEAVVTEDPVEDEVVDPAAIYPPVVAMVVTHNPGPWLDDTLRGLADQDYPDLTVLVVDCGSQVDPTPRVAELLPRAFVRHLAATAGFAEGANEALHTVEGATFLLVCHDDVVLDPTVVRALVEEAYRSNAGIVGPKLVAADDPSVLLDVGRAIDRFGAPYTGIEPGELDQEQHDGVRDVFYVTSATMLVRVDLFTALGGFDPATFPGAEDLDLCWRARLAGARVLVVPDARVAHREAAEERSRTNRPDDVAIARSRVRVLLTSYSLGTLLWLIPFGFVVAIIEAAGDLVTGHPRRARAGITAWFNNVFHFRRLRASRRRAQAARHVHDRDLRELQVGTGTRLTAWFNHHVHNEGRLRSIGAASRSAVDSVSDGVRAPATIAFMVFLALVLFGSRSLIAHSVPAIGTFGTWPGIGDLFNAFGSAWRYTGLGSASAAPPALALMGGLGTALFGAVSLARTLVVVLAIPVGAFGAYRLGNRIIGIRGPALAAGLAYGINPAPRNAISEGRLGPLVLFALLPFLLNATIRIAGRDRDTGADPASPRRRGRLLRLSVLAALLGAWFPVGLGLFVLAAFALVLAIPIAGGIRLAFRALGLAIVSSLLGIVLLFPWPLAYARKDFDSASLGFTFRTPNLDLDNILRFHSGAQGAGWAMWGLLVAAAVPLFTATGPRLAWAARGWMLALLGWGAVWVPARFFPDISVPAPEAGLTVAALGIAIALGIGVSVLVDGIRTFRFGWRQPAAILGGVALLLPVLGFTADTFNGRWRAPEDDWTQTLAFTQSLASRGQFRMLWVGNPTVLPLDPVVLDDGTGYTLTRNGPGNVTEQWRAPQHSADKLVDQAIELSVAGLTNRLGRMLAPMGVRYVVLPSTQGTGGGANAPPSPALRTALSAQLDLARLRSEPGFVLYENLAWIPLRAVVPVEQAGDVPVNSADPTRAAVGVELAAKPAGSGRVPAGTVLWAEAFDSHWTASSGGSDLRHVEAFGWSNGYRLTKAGSVDIAYTGQWQRWALLGGSLVIWLFVIWRWRRTRVRRPRRRGTETERARRERRSRPDPLAEVLDEDAFWWERV